MSLLMVTKRSTMCRYSLSRWLPSGLDSRRSGSYLACNVTIRGLRVRTPVNVAIVVGDIILWACRMSILFDGEDVENPHGREGD